MTDFDTRIRELGSRIIGPTMPAQTYDAILAFATEARDAALREAITKCQMVSDEAESVIKVDHHVDSGIIYGQQAISLGALRSRDAIGALLSASAIEPTPDPTAALAGGRR